MKYFHFTFAILSSLHMNDGFTIKTSSHYTYAKRRRLYMSSDPNREEMPEEIQQMKSTNDTTSASVVPPVPVLVPKAPIDKPYLTIADQEIVGIGGKKGYVYDVNKLKQNLVQKSVRQFKKDLLLLLISPPNNTKADIKRRFQIEEKLAALISANPVATTTDSNLLEGSWELAFESNSAVEILDEARFIYSRKSDQLKKYEMDAGNWKLVNSGGSGSGRLENPLHSFQRGLFLEKLEDDEDPFMVDTVSLFRGLWTVQRFYDITGLTRTSLQLVPSSKNISFCGRHIYESIAEVADSIALNLQFIYLDSDICVSMTGGDKDNLQVYTKNEDWIESRKQRKHVVKATKAWLKSFETPLKLRRKIFSLIGSNQVENVETGALGKLSEEEYSILLRRVYDDNESKLVALRLGDYGDSTKDDDTAWGGKDDPFVHLSAVERQAIMKQMSIGEIKKAGYIQQRFAKKFKRKKSGTQKFRRPSFGDDEDD